MPLIGVGRVEFQRGLHRIERAGADHSTQLLQTFGWCLFSIGCFIAAWGLILASNKVKGRA